MSEQRLKVFAKAKTATPFNAKRGTTLYIKTIIGMYQHFLSLFLRRKEKENAGKRKRNTLFICNPLDCSSPDGRTTCRCSILSLARKRVSRSDGRGAKILQSLTAPIITARFNKIFDLNGTSNHYITSGKATISC